MRFGFQFACLGSLLLAASNVGTATAREPNPKKLQVFILAGQSNMVGHANYITIPQLFADERPAVRKLAGLVFKEGETVSRETVDEQIATRIARDKINNDLRKKVIQGEDATADAQEEVKREMEAHMGGFPKFGFERPRFSQPLSLAPRRSARGGRPC